MRISDWSSDVCSSDLLFRLLRDSVEVGDRPRVDEGTGGHSLRCDADAPLPSGRTPSSAECDRARRDAHGGASGDRHRNAGPRGRDDRSEEHTSELQSLMRISYAVFCLKKHKKTDTRTTNLC